MEDPREAHGLDLLCLPGNKSTIADLAWLRSRGWDHFICTHRAAGKFVVGICAGYQMIGRQIDDPEHVESDLSTVAGLGLLDVITVFEGEKITTRMEATARCSNLLVPGYQIHCGRISSLSGNAIFETLPSAVLEGASADSGKIIGTSIHGLFYTPQFRRHFLNTICVEKGLEPLCSGCNQEASTVRSSAYDRFARLLRDNLLISAIVSMVVVDLVRLR